jgi:hypothetical protein
MHQGAVLPLSEQERHYWSKIQEISDQEDAVILSRKVREADVEPGLAVDQVKVHPPQAFIFPHAQKIHLKNGLTVLYAGNNYLPKIDILIDFEAKQTFDPEGKEGLSNFVPPCYLKEQKTILLRNLLIRLKRMV